MLGAKGLEFERASAAETEARFAREPLFEGIEVAETLPNGLPDASFDRVLLVEVVEHLLDDQVEATLAEVARVLDERAERIVGTSGAAGGSSRTAIESTMSNTARS